MVKALDSPLLNDNKIEGCKNVLLLIVSGEDEITIDEIGEINDLIQSQARNNTNIIMGIGEDKNLKQGISVTIIATGFNSDQQHEIVNTEAKKIIHTLEEEQSFVQDLTDKKDSVESQKHKYSKITPPNDEKSFESQDDYLNKELIQTNQNIKDIETISTQVCFNSDKIDNENENNYDNEEYIDTTEIFDFKEIDDFDSSQIEFDFNDSKKIEVNSPRSMDIKTPNTPEVGNKNVDENFELEMIGNESELEMTGKESELEMTGKESELEKNIEDDLNIKIKDISDGGSSNGENIEVEIKNETPFDNSIEETIKNSNISSKEELKKFNYSFQNSIKRINEMDKQPAYKRLGYNIDQNVENDKKSPLTLDKDKNDEVQLRSNNSFLHDNVD